VAEDADQPMRARKRSSDRIAMAFMRRMDTILGGVSAWVEGMKRGGCELSMVALVETYFGRGRRGRMWELGPWFVQGDVKN
jgi:hypothetical protein